MKKRIMILLILILAVISVFAIIEKPKADEKIEIATLQKYQITKAYNDTVTWKSSKPLVASVSKSGVITGVSSGSAKITGTYKNGKKQVINVTVLKTNKTSITASDIKLSVGESRNITVTTYPASMKNSLTYTSSNILVAKVDKTGKVTAVRDGVATITITAPNLKTKKITVTVGTAVNNIGGNQDNNGSGIFDNMTVKPTITFKEPSEKSVTKDTVVYINYNIVNNDGGNYYYVWNTYTDGNQNYNGLKEDGCLKIKNVESYRVSLTMSRTNRNGEIVIYSDSACTNKIDSKKTSTYTIKSSDINVNLTANVSGTKVEKNTEVTITGTLKNNSKGNYYYRWQDYKNGTKVGSATACTIIKKGETKNSTRKLKINDSGIKTKLEVYTDSSCTQKFKEESSNTYNLKSNTTSSLFSLLFGFLENTGSNIGNVNIKFTSSTNKNNVPYNTVIEFNTTFTNTTGKDYYYKWYTYTGNTQNYVDPTCQKIVNGSTRNVQLAINGKNRSGKFVIYSDASCLNEYKNIKTSSYSYEGEFDDFKNEYTTQNIGGVTVITEKGCISSKVNSMLEAIKSLNSSNLLKNISTIGFYKESSYPRNSGFGHTIVSSLGSKNTIKMKCDVEYSNAFYKESITHEVGHALDNYYKFFINYSNSNNKWYGISYSDEVGRLFNYYKSKSSRPLRSYAFQDQVEFWAESFACYYAGTNGGKTCSLPTTSGYNLKATVASYVSELKNN